MNKSRHNLFSRITAAVLCMILALALFPLNAMAQLGPMSEVSDSEVTYFSYNLSATGTTFADKKYVNSTPKGTYHFLTNEYITFIVRPDGSTSTLPTRVYKDTINKLRTQKTGTSITGSGLDKLPLTEKYRLYKDTSTKEESFADPEIPVNLSVQSITQSGKSIKVTYKQSLGVYLEIVYRLVKVGNGNYNGADLNGTTWAVCADIYDFYETKDYIDPEDIDYDRGEWRQHFLVLVTDHIGFGADHHDRDGVVMAYSDKRESAYTPDYELARTPTTEFGLNINEVYTREFGTDNPFVALGRGYSPGLYDPFGHELVGGVDGHWTPISGGEWSEGGRYPCGIAYGKKAYVNYFGSLGTKQTLTTYNTLDVMWGYHEEPYQNQLGLHGSSLWGFRDLYTGQESKLPNDPEFNYVNPTNGKHLGLVRKNNALQAVPGASLDELKTAHGNDLVAVLRGSFEQKGGNYVFKDGAAALSPTVTATWDSGGEFKVSPQGVITAKGVSLSCPAFRFYTPNSANDGLSIVVQSGKLTAEMTPSANASILHLDIPGATSQVKEAVMGLDGSLEFAGEMGISTPLLDIAEIKLSRVGMGYNDKRKFSVSGIEAQCDVNMPEILGMPSGEVKADINTFNGQEKYDFSLKLEVPNLFEGEFELKLKRLKTNGALAPNKLWLYANSGLGGVPLIPPVVVAELTGLGGGFDGLADTINGDYYYVPPIKLSFKATAEVLKMLDGSAKLTVGLGGYKLELDDVSVMSIPLGAKYMEQLYYGAEKRTYKNTEYTGVAMRGDRELKIALPSEDTGLIRVDTGLHMDLFAGLNGMFCYAMLNADGYVDGGLYFPEKIGSLKLPSKLANEKITGVKLSITYNGESAFAIMDGGLDTVFENMLKNAKNFLTIKYDKKFLGTRLQVYTIFHYKTVYLEYDGWFIDGGGKYSWDGGRSNAMKVASGQTEDGLYYSTFVVSNTHSLGSTAQLEGVRNNGLSAAGIDITANGDEENNYTVTLGNASNPNINPDQVVFQLSPREALNDEELTTQLIIQKEGAASPLTLKLEDYDAQGESIVPDANAYIAAAEEGDAENKKALVVKLPETGTWTISSANGVAFDIECYGFHLPETIKADGSLSNLRLKDKNYVLNAYLVDSADDVYDANDNFYAVEEVDVTASSNWKNIQIGSSYDSVPTGSYTLVYRLHEKRAALDENDQPIVNEKGEQEYVQLLLDEFITGVKINNTNPNQLPAPTDVKLTSIGSDGLRAEWKAPATMPAGRSIDGYYVAVYQKVNGEWVSTNVGYEVRAEKAGDPIPLSVDMALTIHGEDTDNPELLTADNNYRVSVSVLSDLEMDMDGDNAPDEVVAQRSPEAYSPKEGTWLPKATYPVLTYDPAPTTAGDSNMKILDVRAGHQVRVEADVPVRFRVTRTDTNEVLYDTVAAGEDTELNCSFNVPDFEGSLIVKIEAKDKQDDLTTDYIALRRDDVPPVITLDKSSFMANQDGSFTITGVTEPGATVRIDYDYLELEIVGYDAYNDPIYGDYIMDVQMAEDGSFAISGKVDPREVEAMLFSTSEDGVAKAILVGVSAADSAGNSSSTTAFVKGTPPGANNPFAITITDGKAQVAGVSVSEAKENDLVTIIADTKDGYTFKEWQIVAPSTLLLDDTTQATTVFIMPAEAVTLKAVFAQGKSYTVTYNVEGGTWADGTTAPKIEEVEDGQRPSQIPTGMIASEGFEGGAWSPDPSGATITDAASFTYTFTAKQSQPTTISYAAKDGSGNTIQSVTWQKGSGKNLDLTFKRSEDDHLTYGLFGSLEIGGVTVGSANYGAAEGSLKLSVKPEYLETLSVGDHTIKVNFQDGSAAVKLTVLAASAEPTPSPTPKPSEKPASPKTGDESNLALHGSIMFLAVAEMILLLLYARKRKPKNNVNSTKR